MTYLLDTSNYRWRDKTEIDVKCDECNKIFQLTYKSAERNKKNNCGKHVCCECKGVPLKPQNKKDWWLTHSLEDHALKIKASENWTLGIKNRNTKGSSNGMFGKRADVTTRQKMSQSRKGKVGVNATAWKGGKTSLTKRVKGFIHREADWYSKIYRRDNWKCVKCDSKTKIDAHHIEPVWKIIKRLSLGKVFSTEEEKLLWLVTQPEILDLELKNGITLCRECHQKTHRNWGSHETD